MQISRAPLSRPAGSAFVAVIGVVLIPVALFTLWSNEGRAVKTAQGLKEGSGKVVSVEAGQVDAANEGKLIHISGPVTPTEMLKDPDFGISTAALRLQRRVEMFQWKEGTQSVTRDRIDGPGKETKKSYYYEKAWSDKPVSSAAFNQPEGHSNPTSWPYASREWIAGDAKIGAFRVPERLISRMKGTEPMAVAPGAFRTDVTPTPLPHQGGLFLGKDVANPEVGDMRITFKVLKPGPFSIISKQSQDLLALYRAASGAEVELVTAGTSDAATMFDTAVQQNTARTWGIRFGGFVIMAVGMMLLFRPIAAIGSWIPFLGRLVGAGVAMFGIMLAAVASLVVMALAWLAYRPVLSLSLLAVAGALIFLGTKLPKSSSPGTAQAA